MRRTPDGKQKIPWGRGEDREKGRSKRTRLEDVRSQKKQTVGGAIESGNCRKRRACLQKKEFRVGVPGVAWSQKKKCPGNSDNRRLFRRNALLRGTNLRFLHGFWTRPQSSKGKGAGLMQLKMFEPRKPTGNPGQALRLSKEKMKTQKGI